MNKPHHPPVGLLHRPLRRRHCRGLRLRARLQARLRRPNRPRGRLVGARRHPCGRGCCQVKRQEERKHALSFSFAGSLLLRIPLLFSYTPFARAEDGAEMEMRSTESERPGNFVLMFHYRGAKKYKKKIKSLFVPSSRRPRRQRRVSLAHFFFARRAFFMEKKVSRSTEDFFHLFVVCSAFV